MNDFDDLVAALVPIVAILRRLGVGHYVGGSVASTFHGAIRSTMDVDLVCSLSEPQAEALIAACGADYYASVAAAREAVRQRKCFNLIHLPTSYKIDVFVSRGRTFDRAALERGPAGIFRAPCDRIDPRRDGGGLHPGKAGMVSADGRDVGAAMGRRFAARPASCRVA